jgi:hypothetical protein
MGNHNKSKLSIIFDKRQKDFIVKYPRRCDGALILNHICSDVLKHVMPSKKEPPFNFEAFNLVDELESRGYDTKTLRFSVELRPTIKHLDS